MTGGVLRPVSCVLREDVARRTQHAARRTSWLVVLTCLLAAACAKTPSVPTYKVEAARFTRRVTADGNLKSTKATPLSAPTDAPPGPLKISWIVADGSLLKKDEVVVRFDPTDFEQQLVAGHSDRNTALNGITKSDTESGTTRTNLRRDATQADAELDAARRFKFDDAEVFSRFQRIESQIDEHYAADKKQYAQGVLKVRDKLSKADRDLLAIEQKKADLKIHNAEQGLHALEVRAPYDGILVLQRDWRGDTVRTATRSGRVSPSARSPTSTP